MIPQLLDHPNTAESWTGLIVVTPDNRFEAALRHFEAVYGVPPKFVGGRYRFQPREIFLDVVPQRSALDALVWLELPAALERPIVAGIFVRVRSRAALIRLLEAGDMAFTIHGPAVATPRLPSLGTQLLFAEK